MSYACTRTKLYFVCSAVERSAFLALLCAAWMLRSPRLCSIICDSVTKALIDCARSRGFHRRVPVYVCSRSYACKLHRVGIDLHEIIVAETGKAGAFLRAELVSPYIHATYTHCYMIRSLSRENKYSRKRGWTALRRGRQICAACQTGKQTSARRIRSA